MPTAGPIRFSGALLVTLLLVTPILPVEAIPVGSPVAQALSIPPPVVPALAGDSGAGLLEAYRIASLRPEIRALLEYHAERNGWILPPPVLRDLSGVEAPLPAALDAFAATFAPSRSEELAAVASNLSSLPDELGRALATLLYAVVDAQALQLAALAPLGAREVEALARGTATPQEAAAIVARANVPLTLQAAATLDAAVAQTDPILKKWGLLLAIQNLGTRPIALDALVASLPALGGGDPLATLGWADALLGAGAIRPRAPSAPPLPEAILAYWLGMGIAPSFDDLLALSAARGLDPRLSDAVSLNLAAGAAVWYATLPSNVDPGIADLAQQVAAIAAGDGATPADLAVLSRYLDVASADATPSAAELVASLVDAARATDSLLSSGASPLAPQTASHEGISVGDVRVVPRSYPNGTNSVTVKAGATERTYWGEAVKAFWDHERCSLTVWDDRNRNGRPEGDAQYGGEQYVATRPLCDLPNDVLFQDPYGYVVVTGEGSTVLDDRFGKVVSQVARTNRARSDAWGAWNDTWFPSFIPRFVSIRAAGADPSQASVAINVPNALFYTRFLCFGFVGGIAPPDPYCDLQREGDAVFAGMEENATLNPDSFQILTIDLGGDDVYRNNVGGTLNSTLYEVELVESTTVAGRKDPVFRQRSPTEPYVAKRYRIPIALAIDLGGNDTYSPTRQYTMGSSDVGVGFLFDSGGNDRYEGVAFTVASANTPGFTARPEDTPLTTRGASLAAAIDLSGDDEYATGHHSLAFANRSAFAFFYNGEGNDRYRSGRESQAFSNGTSYLRTFPLATSGDVRHHGYGVALFVELAGNDEYDHTARRVPGSNVSDWAQGRAVNHGIAVLLDLRGTDRGIASTGEASAGSILTARFATRARSDQFEDPRAGNTPSGRTRSGSNNATAFALDLDTSPASANERPPGYVYAAPGIHAEQNEDPFFRLHFYVDVPGLLGLGAEGRTDWSRDFILGLDLGGDDLWRARPGSASFNVDSLTQHYGSLQAAPGTAPSGGLPYPKWSRMGQTNLVGLTIDVDGNDRYNVSDRGAGYGLLGIGMHYDRAARAADGSFGRASDRYDLGWHSGGAGVVLGLGALHDEGGNDNYTAYRDAYSVSRTLGESRALGFAERAGVGLLVDGDGDDQYAGLRWSVGTVVGNASAEFGAFLDARGVDTYRLPKESTGAWRELKPEARTPWPVSINFTEGRPSPDRPHGPSVGGFDGTARSINGPTALFIDDGFDADRYFVPPIGGGRDRRNDASWVQPSVEPGFGSDTGAGSGAGYDNLDAYLHKEMLRYLDPATGPGQVAHPFGPDFHAVRALLLSPGVEFMLPTAGESPVGNRKGNVPVEVVATAADSRAVHQNALRLANFLLFEEVQRYECNRVDPYRDPAKAAPNPNVNFADPSSSTVGQGNPGLWLGNPLGGPHEPKPFYCGTLAGIEGTARDTVKLQTGVTLAGGESALPLFLPLLVLALDEVAKSDDVLGGAALTSDVAPLLAEVGALALRGGSENLERAAAILATSPAFMTASAPVLPAHPNELLTQTGRVRGSEDIKRVVFYLNRTTGFEEVGRCELSGAANDVAACSSVPGVSVWFANRDRPCRSEAGWGCFELDWTTDGIDPATGDYRFPDGVYELEVLAYYREAGTGKDTPLAAEDRVNERLTDNYDRYPGWNRRIFTLDNKPRIYAARTFVGDFVPDDPDSGTFVFDGVASEPIRYQVFVRPPLESDYQQLFAPGFRNTDGFAPVDEHHRCVDEATGQRIVSCTPQNPRETQFPVRFTWRPVDALPGLYHLRVLVWDRTHLPTSAPDRGVQNVFDYTFWGDGTPPVAVPYPVPSKVHRALEGVSIATPTAQDGTFKVHFREDADALAGAGSNLSKVRISSVGQNLLTKAYLNVTFPDFVRPSGVAGGPGVMNATIPIVHGWRYELTVRAIDRAGNVQGTPTSIAFDTDLLAPTTAQVPLPPRMNPLVPLTFEWPRPVPDDVYGADVVEVVIEYAIADTGASPTAWTRLPVANVTMNATSKAGQATFSPPALGLADVAKEPKEVSFRVVAVDAFGNRETSNGLPKVHDGPVAFDTTPPRIVNDLVSIAPTHDRAVLEWSFHEASSRQTTVFAYAVLGATTGAEGECSAPAGAALSRTAVLSTVNDGVTWRALLGSAAEPLPTGHVVEFEIRAHDLVGNAFTSERRRFCTDPVADVSILAPLAGATLTRTATAAWRVSDPRVATGLASGGDRFTYNVTVLVAGTLHAVGLRSDFETVEGSNDRSLAFDSRLLPDAASARLVLFVNSSLNPHVPLRIESAEFKIDNTAPATAFRIGSAALVAGTWLSAPATIVLQPTDAVSPTGIRTFSSLDNRTFSEASSVRISADGPVTLYAYSEDVAGNRERVRSVSFGLDTTPPSAAVVVANGVSVVRSNKVLVEVSVADAPSGVASIAIRSPGGGPPTVFGSDRLIDGALALTWTLPGGDGDKAVEVVATDLAGNEVTARAEITVDNTAPVLRDSAFEEVGFTTAILLLETDEDAKAAAFLKRATDAAFQTRLESGLTTNLHRIPMSRLFPATDYVVRVVLRDGIGNEAAHTLNFTTRLDETAPGQIRNLATRDRAEGFLLVDWTASDDDVGVERYRVFRALGSAEPEFLAHAYAPRFLDANLTPGKEYAYRVQAEDAAGNLGPLSDPATGRATTRPTLTEASVTPEAGAAGTVFRWSIVYRDLDGDVPSSVRVVVNGKPHDMKPTGDGALDVRKGVTYVYDAALAQTRLSTGMNSFHFEASDGTHFVRTLLDGVGPLVVGPEAAVQSGGGLPFAGFFAAIREAPAAAWPALLALVALAAVLLRRRASG